MSVLFVERRQNRLSCFSAWNSWALAGVPLEERFSTVKTPASKSKIALITVVAAVLIAAALLPFIFVRTMPAKAPCVNNLRQLDGAKQQWALENRKTTNDVPTLDDVRPFLHHALACPEAGSYVLGRVDALPKCSIGGLYHTLQ
jgi:hypothetical protein